MKEAYLDGSASGSLSWGCSWVLGQSGAGWGWRGPVISMLVCMLLRRLTHKAAGRRPQFLTTGLLKRPHNMAVAFSQSKWPKNKAEATMPFIIDHKDTHHHFCHIPFIRNEPFWDFPGGAVVKNPPANAGGHWFDPWSGKISHAAEQLSPWATTTEPACHNYWSPRT